MRIELTCDRCGTTFSRIPSRVRDGRNFCSQGCYRAASRKDVVATRYRMVNVGPSHPLAGKSGVVPEHRVVLYDAIGPGPHPCSWCGRTVEWAPGKHTSQGALVVDHVDGDPKNNARENLVPSCHTCNSRRRVDRVTDDEDYVIVRSTGNRTRAEVRTCRTCGASFKVAPSTARSKKNGGRYCSRECLWARSRG